MIDGLGLGLCVASTASVRTADYARGGPAVRPVETLGVAPALDRPGA
jgi:hypothetical protein